MSTRERRGAITGAAAALAATLAVSSCGDFFTEPAPPAAASVAVSFAPAGPGADPAFDLLGGADDAFDAVDAVRIRLVRESTGDAAFDESVPVSPEGATAEVRVEIDLEEESEPCRLEVELRDGTRAIFRGEARTTLRAGEVTAVEVPLEAVPVAIRMPAEAPAFEVLLDTIRVSAAVVFATGDTIPGLAPTWSSRDPGIVRALPDGRLISVADGEARIVATHDDLTGTLTVRVRAVAAAVVVEPATVVIPPGATRQLVATVLDRRDHPIPGREVAWSSSDPGVAPVDASGLVTGAGPGTAAVTATADGASGSAEVTVVADPPSVTTLDAAGVTTTSATLRGSVVPNGTSTEAWFEWSTRSDLSGAASTAPRSIGAGLEAASLDEELTGLEPGTTYHYRAAAANAAGTSRGGIRSFSTQAPTIERSPASLSFSTLAWTSNPAPQQFTVRNAGAGSLHWSVSANRSWISLSPASGTSTGETDAVTVSVDADSTAAGSYAGTVTISAPDATNSPRTVAVNLDVIAHSSVISGQVFYDDNPVGGMTVINQDLLVGGVPVATATNSNGYYSFAGLVAGSYTIEIVPSSVGLPASDFQATQGTRTVDGTNSATLYFWGWSPTAPVLMNMRSQLVQLNDASFCGHQSPPGSHYRILADFSDVNADVLSGSAVLRDSSAFSGYPASVRSVTLPGTDPGTNLSYTLSGSGSTSGTVTLTNSCLVFSGSSSFTAHWTLRDAAGNWSNTASVTIARPAGANAPPVPGSAGSGVDGVPVGDGGGSPPEPHPDGPG